MHSLLETEGRVSLTLTTSAEEGERPSNPTGRLKKEKKQDQYRLNINYLPHNNEAG